MKQFSIHSHCRVSFFPSSVCVCIAFLRSVHSSVHFYARWNLPCNRKAFGVNSFLFRYFSYASPICFQFMLSLSLSLCVSLVCLHLQPTKMSMACIFPRLYFLVPLHVVSWVTVLCLCKWCANDVYSWFNQKLFFYRKVHHRRKIGAMRLLRILCKIYLFLYRSLFSSSFRVKSYLFLVLPKQNGFNKRNSKICASKEFRSSGGRLTNEIYASHIQFK